MLSSAISYAVPPRWPLKGQIDLSSGFGDFRRSRFHAGLDLRTGGVSGKPVFAPVSGWILRIKMSYTGYGKGLYLQGDDGSLYVFGHLSRFVDLLDSRVKAMQLAQRRYYVDWNLPADSVRVKAGELLAYSGQTGAGAPHLHFEKRSGGNVPVNPLTHGFELKDKVRPVFSRVGVQLMDDRSLFDDGSRRVFLDLVPSKSNTYVLKTPLLLNAPFGILIDGFDLMRRDGLKQAIYRLALYVDGAKYYEVVLDTLDFSDGKAADFVYDYVSAVDGEPRVRSLFWRAGDSFKGVTADSVTKGIFGRDGHATVGKHQVRIVGTDVSDNSTEVRFEFLWGPPDFVYRTDSSVVINDTTMHFFLSPAVDPTPLQFDSVVVFVGKQGRWGRPPTAWVHRSEGDRLKVVVNGRYIDRVVLRLELYPRLGGHFGDIVFCGLRETGVTKYSVHHQVLDDGLLVWTEHLRPNPGPSQVELYYQGKLLGIQRAKRFTNQMRHLFFVAPKPEYRRIDSLVVRMGQDTMQSYGMAQRVDVRLVGLDDRQEITVDSLFVLHCGRDAFYEPQFIELKKSPIVTKGTMNLNSDAYIISPPDFPLRQNLSLSYRMLIPNESNSKSGLCRLDDSGNTWLWQGGMEKDSLLHASADRCGTYAAVFDFDAPTMKNLNVTDGQLLRDRMPLVRFTLWDSLSGIEDDRSIVLKIDGKWVIPEYDPEAEICQTQPVEPLADGEHHLSIEVKDRVGNEAHRYLKFRVAAPAPSAQGKK
ncbi:MAG: hypothetical protein AB1644_13265 [Candidatus Zixiibacteriota bacterium]